MNLVDYLLNQDERSKIFKNFCTHCDFLTNYVQVYLCQLKFADPYFLDSLFWFLLLLFVYLPRYFYLRLFYHLCKIEYFSLFIAVVFLAFPIFYSYFEYSFCFQNVKHRKGYPQDLDWNILYQQSMQTQIRACLDSTQVFFSEIRRFKDCFEYYLQTYSIQFFQSKIFKGQKIIQSNELEQLYIMKKNSQFFQFFYYYFVYIFNRIIQEIFEYQIMILSIKCSISINCNLQRINFCLQNLREINSQQILNIAANYSIEQFFSLKKIDLDEINSTFIQNSVENHLLKQNYFQVEKIQNIKIKYQKNLWYQKNLKTIIQTHIYNQYLISICPKCPKKKHFFVNLGKLLKQERFKILIDLVLNMHCGVVYDSSGHTDENQKQRSFIDYIRFDHNASLTSGFSVQFVNGVFDACFKMNNLSDISIKKIEKNIWTGKSEPQQQIVQFKQLTEMKIQSQNSNLIITQFHITVKNEKGETKVHIFKPKGLQNKVKYQLRTNGLQLTITDDQAVGKNKYIEKLRQLIGQRLKVDL